MCSTYKLSVVCSQTVDLLFDAISDTIQRIQLQKMKTDKIVYRCLIQMTGNNFVIFQMNNFNWHDVWGGWKFFFDGKFQRIESSLFISKRALITESVQNRQIILILVIYDCFHSLTTWKSYSTNQHPINYLHILKKNVYDFLTASLSIFSHS